MVLGVIVHFSLSGCVNLLLCLCMGLRWVRLRYCIECVYEFEFGCVCVMMVACV